MLTRQQVYGLIDTELERAGGSEALLAKGLR
jgi:hypothetical protein